MEVNATLASEVTALLMPEQTPAFAPGDARVSGDRGSLSEDIPAFALLLLQAEPARPAALALPGGGNFLPPPAATARAALPPPASHLLASGLPVAPPPGLAAAAAERAVTGPAFEADATVPVVDEAAPTDSSSTLRRRAELPELLADASPPGRAAVLTPPLPPLGIARAGGLLPLNPRAEVVVNPAVSFESLELDEALVADSSPRRPAFSFTRGDPGRTADGLPHAVHEPAGSLAGPGSTAADAAVAVTPLPLQEPARAEAQARPAEGTVTLLAAAPAATEAGSSAAIDAAKPTLELPARAPLPDALAERVHWMIDQNLGSARLRLNPPHLGALDIRISVGDDGAFVQFTTSHAAARDAIELALPRLREMLGSAGLELSGATVGGEHASRERPPMPFVTAPEPSVAALAEPTALAAAAGRRQIDLYA